MRKNNSPAKSASFPEMVEKWKSMERKTFEQREEAQRFYEENLMRLIEQDFVKRNGDMITEPVDYLIMSVGTSYEPLVLNISLLKPKKILFLCTEKTESQLDKIIPFCDLKMKDFQRRIVSETDPIDIYCEIKDFYLAWGKPEKIYIDFTGGTKAMSAAAALAGAMINVQLLYVGTDNYLTDFRKPEPGSEILYFITNPIEIFCDLEIEKAYELFSRNNYIGAAEKLDRLKEEVPDPKQRQTLELAYLLAKTYEHWDALEFSEAYENIVKLNKYINRDKRTRKDLLFLDKEKELKEQEKILKKLNDMQELIRERRFSELMANKEYLVPLMFSLMENSKIREKQEKYDMATLLLYRVLEMIEQSRLSEYGLYVSDMNYKNIDFSASGDKELSEMGYEAAFNRLKNNYFEIKKALFKKANNPYLPDTVSLLDGFIILASLKDSISYDANGDSINKLKRIRSMVFLRNNSIFAHGLGPVKPDDFKKFRNFVTGLLREYCSLEEIEYEKYMKAISWIEPLNSKYHTGTEE